MTKLGLIKKPGSWKQNEQLLIRTVHILNPKHSEMSKTLKIA